MKKFFPVLILLFISGNIYAQNVGIGTSTPAEKLEVNGKTKTINLQVTNGAAGGYLLQSDGSGNASWVPPARSGTIPFSTGIIISGATVVSAAPILMGFGNHTVEVIDGSGQSTFPPEAGGFSFIVPFDGMISNLTVSTDLLVASVASINVTPLTYVFTVHRSPMIMDGMSHISQNYVTQPYSSSVTFGGPAGFVIPGIFYSAANINSGSFAVSAGDRIGVRIRTMPSSDPSAADITQLSFNASLSYTY